MTRLSGLTLAGLIAALAPASARAQTFGADGALSLERLVSGIKIATRQDSTSTEQSATTAIKAAEANASAITASDSALRIAQAKHAYSYETARATPRAG